MVKNPNVPARAGISATPAEENPKRKTSAAYPKQVTAHRSMDTATPPASYTAQ